MSMATIRQAVRDWLHDPDIYAFTDSQIDTFLLFCKVQDADGYKPEQDDWTPTYDVKKAAGQGWVWLGALTENKVIVHKLGDIQITIDKDFCVKRAKELLGSSTSVATRRDEPCSEQIRKKYYDGDNPRYMT